MKGLIFQAVLRPGQHLAVHWVRLVTHLCAETRTHSSKDRPSSAKSVCVCVGARVVQTYLSTLPTESRREGERERKKENPPPPPQITILITEGRLREGEKEKSSKNCFCTSRRKFNDILKLIVFLFTSVPSSTDSTLIWF